MQVSERLRAGADVGDGSRLARESAHGRQRASQADGARDLEEESCAERQKGRQCGRVDDGLI